MEARSKFPILPCQCLDIPSKPYFSYLVSHSANLQNWNSIQCPTWWIFHRYCVLLYSLLCEPFIFFPRYEKVLLTPQATSILSGSSRRHPFQIWAFDYATRCFADYHLYGWGYNSFENRGLCPPNICRILYLDSSMWTFYFDIANHSFIQACHISNTHWDGNGPYFDDRSYRHPVKPSTGANGCRHKCKEFF